MRRRVAPFGNPRINGYLLLPEAYRSLSRPSSAPDAKAFPLRSFQLDLLVTKSAWLRFRFRKNFAHSPAPRFSPKTGFRRGGTGYEFCSELSENSWFSLRIMQAYKDRNCMSPCILSNAVPQSICFVMCFHTTPLCCLTCFVTLFSFQGAGLQPLLQSDLKIRSSDQVFKSKGKSPGGPEWARTTDLTIISRTL